VKINIFGMGYVGCVSAACLANEGNEVLGIDIDTTKIKIINSGKSPIVERGLNEAISEAVSYNGLIAISNKIKEIREADISIVCVGTPSKENGSLNLEVIKEVSKQIGCQLKNWTDYHVVNVRSTVLPGTTEETIIPILEKTSGKKVGKDFGVCVNPEFMREGSSLRDFYNPPFTIIGQYDQRSGDRIAQIYSNINAPIIKTNIKVAEMIKYASNSFHALKISFANEIGNVCKRLKVDSHEVMEIFCRDTKLNISPYYLKPGFAFGGSCLPKDLRAILYTAKEQDLETPLLSSVLRSNRKQIDIAYNLIKKTGSKKVGILGLSFKPGTDDLRESPMVDLVEKLLGKGYHVSIYDKEVALAKIIGSNKRYIQSTIPHISSLMIKTAKGVINNADVIVVGKKNKEFKNIVSTIDRNKILIDLVRIVRNPEENDGCYEGICW